MEKKLKKSFRKVRRRVLPLVLPMRASPFFTPDLSSDESSLSHGGSKLVLAAILETVHDLTEK